ncbi:MAG: hypothetical protein AB1439_00435 [candidate division FCPU426 bacterium]
MKATRYPRVASLAVFLAALLAHSASALTQIPERMNYQGYLTNSSGVPINGTRNITFYIYDTASGGMALWSELQSNVTVTNGIFNVVLGTSNKIGLPFRRAYYLTLRVQGEAAEMSPRHLLSNAAYAMASRKVVYQQVLTVAADGGDTCTVSGAIDLLMGAGAFSSQGALSPAPSVTTPWVIEVQAGQYTEPGTNYPSFNGRVTLPSWVTIRGQGWNATKLAVNSIEMSSSGSPKQGTALESLLIQCDSANPAVDVQSGAYCTLRECKLEASSCTLALRLTGAQHCEVVDSSLLCIGFTPGWAVLVQQSTDVRVENCVIDMTNASNSGCAGITDNSNAAAQLCILENTILYITTGTPTGSYAVGLTNGGTGRISYNAFYGGAASRDIINLATGALPVNPFTPDGICNQDSSGAQMAAF